MIMLRRFSVALLGCFLLLAVCAQGAAAVDYTLSVIPTGTGDGGVRSLTTGIDCGGNCSAAFPGGSVITLTAAPAAGSWFSGWGGDACVGNVSLTCLVTMDGAKSVTAGFADTPPALPTWAKTYGDVGYDAFYSIQQTADGGFIAVGDTDSSGAGSSDLWVMKLQADGTVEWQKAYGGIDADYAGFYHPVIQTADGGYVVAGSTFGSFAVSPTTYDVWVLKLNGDGTVAWEKRYDNVSQEEGFFIQQTADGGYILAGSQSANVPPYDQDGLLIKLQADGSIAWQKRYGGTDTDYVLSVRQAVDSGFVTAGWTRSFGGGGLAYGWIQKLNGNGTLAWSKTYYNASEDMIFLDVQAASDGGYIVAGLVGADACALKLDGSGVILWEKRYPGLETIDTIRPTADGGYIAQGSATIGDDTQAVILKLLTDGTIDWQKSYGGANPDYLYDIQPVADGGYVAAGYSSSFNEAASDDAWLLKLDGDGNIFGCPGGMIGTPAVTDQDASFTDTVISPTVANSTLSPFVTDATITDTLFIPGDVCNGVASLTVTRTGTGTGTVVADSGAIDCGGVCADDYPSGTLVTLFAIPDFGAAVTGWSGACVNSGPVCQVTMDDAKSVTATFNLPTVKSGDIAAHTTWTRDGGPYHVTTGFAVNAGITLTIEPGTIIKFASGAVMNIFGNLHAPGTSDNYIYFTSISNDAVGGDTNGDGTSTTPTSNDWNGIWIGSNATATLDFCDLSYGGPSTGMIFKTGFDSLSVTNSTISNYALAGIQLVNFTSLAAISNNIILGDGSATYGIYLYNAAAGVTISENAILEAGIAGISISEAGTTPAIYRNLITGNYVGIYIASSAQPVIGGSPGNANFLYDNTLNGGIYSVQNTGTNTVNATYNWWGSADGPYHPTTNSGGNVNSQVSDYVDYGNYLIYVGFIDIDDDGIDDALDNCPLLANADQLDTDDDGRGDACDEDDDNDGLLDGDEIALGTDPLNPDTDGDKIGDASDNYPTSVDANFSNAGVFHETRADGTTRDAIIVAINAAGGTALTGLTATVTGPPGFSPLNFADTDLYELITQGDWGVTSEYASLPEGHYTFTVTDARGNSVHQVDLMAGSRTLPRVDPATVTYARLADGAYQFNWGLAGTAESFHYRLWIHNADGKIVFSSPRVMTTTVTVPAGLLIDDSSPYGYRIEVHDSTSVFSVFNRSVSAWQPFTPSQADYDADRPSFGWARAYNLFDAGGTAYTVFSLGVCATCIDAAVVLDSSGAEVYAFDLVADLAHTENLAGDELSALIPGSLPPGKYTFRISSGELNWDIHAVLTPAVQYPPPDAGTYQAFELADGSLRSLHSDVDHTGLLFYRTSVLSPDGLERVNSPRSPATMNMWPAPPAPVANVVGHAEVWDSDNPTAVRNVRVGAETPISVIPYDASRPTMNWAYVTHHNDPPGISRFIAEISPSDLENNITALVADGPNDFHHDLLTDSYYQIWKGEDLYTAVIAGAPQAGLYTLTADDATGKQVSYYDFQPAAKVLDIPDYHQFHVDQLATGKLRFSWAPLSADIPLFYRLEIYTRDDFNGDNFRDVVLTSNYNRETFAIIDPADLPEVPLQFRIRAADSPVILTTNNRATSAWVGYEGAGFDYASLANLNNNDKTDNLEESAPPVDGDLFATPMDGQVELNWTAATDDVIVTGYKLVFSTDGMPADCSGTAIFTGSDLDLTYIQGDLTNGTTYYYRLCASDAAGNWSPGATASATPALRLGHILDVNTVALWRLDEATNSANAIDETGTYALQQFGSPDVVSGRIDNGRLLAGSSKFFQKQGDGNFGAALNGDWTYEGWIYLDPTFGVQANLFIYNGLAFSFSQPDTILAEIGIMADRKIYWHQWQSTGSYSEVTSNATLQTGRYYHVAVSRTAEGGNLFTYRIYVNGLIDKTTTGVAGLAYPVPGASHYIGLGNFTSIAGFGVGGNVLNGRLDDTRISKIARSDAEILQSFQRGATNSPPTANAQSVSVEENASQAITLTGDDPDPDTLSYVIDTPPVHGVLSGSAPNLIYTPAIGYVGGDSFTFTISDGELVSTETVSITVTQLYQTVTFATGGNGTLTGTASQTVPWDGSTTAVTANPNTGYHFVNWTGTGGFVTTAANPLTINDIQADMDITANFAIDQHNLDVSLAGTGGGSVSSSPAGINCPSGSCTAAFDANTGVTLTAAPDGTSAFTGWSGACTGTGACTVTMSAARSVTATFAAICAAPSALTASASSQSPRITTSWPASTTPSAAYELQLDSGSGFTTIYSGTSRSYAYNAPGNGSYLFRVRTTRANYAPSAWQAAAAVQLNLTCVSPSKLSVPSKARGGSVKATWTASTTTGAQYELQISYGGGAYTPLYTGSALSFNATGLAAGKYTFRVRAIKTGYAPGAWRTSTVCTMK